MKTFVCETCGNKVYFESTTCVNCNHALGFHADTLAVKALVPAGTTGLYRRVDTRAVGLVRYCSNAVHGVCNWLMGEHDATGLCQACKLNRTIPNLAETGNLPAWGKLEHAKKRLLYSVLRFGLPFRHVPPRNGSLLFDFVRNAGTGHFDGVITIDVTETDAVERERQRQFFQEPYRSLLGHLRHESGHFYWMLLVDAAGKHDAFRRHFGDERQNYQTALAHHHAAGPPADWQARHVSAYASVHPWEDWAETWAHYLHMVDALDTAEAAGMEPRAAGFAVGSLWPFKPSNVYRDVSFEALIQRWVPLTIAMNNLSRSMGHEDFYPFVIPAAARDKLEFIHGAIRAIAR